MGSSIPAAYEAARAALANCVKLDECKTWADQAAAMEVYARQAKDRELEANAIEIRVRAERRLGELIKAQKETVGLRGPKHSKGGGSKGSKREPLPDAPPTLAEAGIDKKLSSRCQKLAAVPEAEFEKVLADVREQYDVGRHVSASMVRQAAMAKPKPNKPKRKTKQQKEYEAAQEQQAQAVRQQWVAEGRATEDYEAGIDDPNSAVWEWRRAWGRASVEEEREAWLLDHPGNPLPEHMCSLSEEEDTEYDRWSAQREASGERVLALKSEQHLSHLMTAWDAADQEARRRFLEQRRRSPKRDDDREPEAA